MKNKDGLPTESDDIGNARNMELAAMLAATIRARHETGRPCRFIDALQIMKTRNGIPDGVSVLKKMGATINNGAIYALVTKILRQNKKRARKRQGGQGSNAYNKKTSAPKAKEWRRFVDMVQTDP